MGSERKFGGVAVGKDGKNYEKLISRQSELYGREGDIRTPFARDYTRILHSNAYRRLKHKTQVFFNTDNDHVCTRMEHVAHVDSVAYTIAVYLGLNEELTRAIAVGHDLGHAPFGHHGERVLDKLSREMIGQSFWHERNGLRFVDDVELLEDYLGVQRNLDLTYAVRDGIISHCGEVDENGLRPREELCDLYDIKAAGELQPATWEGCVVKLADKIAYLGRDIEDALSLGVIDGKKLGEIEPLPSGEVPNTTVIIHGLISDVCENSSPESGIRMSEEAFSKLKAIKQFNLDNIYTSHRFDAFENYSELIINTLFKGLHSLWGKGDIWREIDAYSRSYPLLGGTFRDWLGKYCDEDVLPAELKNSRLANRKIYGALPDENTYSQAVIDFISGMTDHFAIKLFGEQLAF